MENHPTWAIKGKGHALTRMIIYTMRRRRRASYISISFLARLI
jgi:hypothetical protein